MEEILLTATHKFEAEHTKLPTSSVIHCKDTIMKNKGMAYYSFDTNGKLNGCHYYIQDYQGNNRIVVNAATNTVEKINHYYSYGSLMGVISTKPDAQQYDPGAPDFTSPDPLAHKYYWLSPYSYCGGDPVNCIDPTGMEVIADSLGQNAIINSLPEAERSSIHFDSDGKMSIDNVDNPSEILSAISTLSNSSTTYNVKVRSTDMNGKKFSNDPNNFYKGYTQTPQDPDYPSNDGQVHIYISSLLSDSEQALNFGHEGLGHALFYEIGLPFGHDYELQSTKVFYEDEGVWGFDFVRVDKNVKLVEQINKMTNLIRKNWK